MSETSRMSKDFLNTLKISPCDTGKPIFGSRAAAEEAMQACRERIAKEYKNIDSIEERWRGRIYRPENAAQSLLTALENEYYKRGEPKGRMKDEAE